MKRLPLFTLFLTFLVTSCATTDHPVRLEKNISPRSLQNNEYIYWVNSLKKNCIGVAPMQCLQIQKGEELTADGWQLFYNTIKGFKYKQGYLYKIIVKEEFIPSEKVPADASSRKYTLVSVLKKQRDAKLRLYDIWALEAIEGKRVNPADGQERPRLEINLQKMAIAGNDGCNDFMGRIASVDLEKLTFGPIAATMKACSDMEITNIFHRHINNIQSYAIKGLKLYLFDSQGHEIFRLQKTD